jgi:hypothetical protein
LKLLIATAIANKALEKLRNYEADGKNNNHPNKFTGNFRNKNLEATVCKVKQQQFNKQWKTQKTET